MELGSNFELDISNLEYCKDNTKQYLKDVNSIYTDSGRSAIKLLAKKMKKGKILLPAYICKSVIDCFVDQYEIDYYLINKNFEINLESLKQKLDENVVCVYLMHYFGKVQNEDVLELLRQKREKEHYLIIEDVTHSFLSQKYTIGDYQICSLRKWFAIPDGGVLYSKNSCKIGRLASENPNTGDVCEAMLLKYLYIHHKVDCNRVYRKKFVDYENLLDEQKKIYEISDISRIFMENISLERVGEIRKRNWNFLHEAIKNEFLDPVCKELADNFVPFAFPVFVKERNRFRKYLIDHQIYCAVHWPIEIEEQKRVGNTQFLSEHMISLPIDQRYTLEAMKYMANIINQYR